jgi:hypothetical protein
VNVSEIIKDQLWIGSKPDPGTYCFDLIVLAAYEYPLRIVGSIEGPKIIEVGLPDRELNNQQVTRALEAAQTVAKYLSEGKKVCCTCAMGINRSSLVAALSLVLLGVPPRRVISRIRKARGIALTNPWFIEQIYETYLGIKP